MEADIKQNKKVLNHGIGDIKMQDEYEFDDTELDFGAYDSETEPCPYAEGDEEGLCVKHSYGCHYVGCKFAD